MTDSEINRRIAELCGWTHLNCKPYDLDCLELKACYGFMRAPDGRTGQPPDYCNDLNAMHEAEKVLSSKQQEIYAAILADCVCHDEDVVINTVDDLLPEDYFRCAHATAAQRSQAFLMTVGLWKD